MPAEYCKVAAALAIAVTAVGTPFAEAQQGAPDTYPEEALKLRQEGRVVTHLLISDIGLVKSCTIAASSGSPSLDADACDKLLKRARFAPARDGTGNAVESETNMPVRYVLPKK